MCRSAEIVAGNRSITAGTGLRLARFFRMSDEFWIGLQMDHDAAIAKDALAKIKPWTETQGGVTV